MRINNIIYLDYNSTTPVAPQVIEAMESYHKKYFGNPASQSHQIGKQAQQTVERAKNKISSHLQIDSDELIFTSGATESVNLALRGIAETYGYKRTHFIVSKTEHKAVLDCCNELEKNGVEIDYLNVNSDGHIDLSELKSSVKDNTRLLALMSANNETGVKHNLTKVGEFCAQEGILFFSDATQTIGKEKLHPKKLGIHLMAFSAHKFYGPKGIGGLYISGEKPPVKLHPQIFGGSHQRNLRSGTLNVPGIVGMAEALSLACANVENEQKRLGKLRDSLENTLIEEFSDEIMQINGAIKNRLSHVSNFSIRGIDATELMQRVQSSLAMASGSACTSSELEPSYVLRAMGKTFAEAKGSIRISLGKFTDITQIEESCEILIKEIRNMRND